jgi:FMN-dependent NADH-azoreductase
MQEKALVQFKLMLPAGLKARVEAAAKENRRSLSQEIVDTLEREYPAPDPVETIELTEEAIASIRSQLQAADMPEDERQKGERMISSMQNLISVLRKYPPKIN